ncbi:MAG: copper amine oxidase N-terminal domain-containing protein [Clostridiales bacterium]|nr:copper amine oxidase N-terminal domain-containing protein [Clostridiales bacterium]
MKKKILGLCLTSAAIIVSCLGVTGGEEYVPLRKTFEEESCSVLWQPEEPGKITVDMGEYPVEFENGSSSVTVDEGEFSLSKAVYIEDGVTYMPEETYDLCHNLYLYHNAIIDATVAEEDEILPLKAIDTSKDSVLVCTWNRYPDSYKTGEEITISYGDVWVFTADEISEWGKENGMAEDMVLRMEQLIGLPPQKGYTHFSLLWVSPEDLYRPARDSEIDDTAASLTFPEGTSEEYTEWFNSYAESSYNPHKYPWTGLGYTYDWSKDSGEYGLSEFVLKDGSKALVEKTYTNEEFFEYITGE